MPTTYAVPNGRTAMAATTYSGTGANQSISNAVNGVSFQPDLVWVKTRSNTNNHNWQDSVRGVTSVIQSNNYDAQSTVSVYVTSFNSNGFSLGADTFGGANYSGYTYVGWQWKGGGTAVSNTSGTLTSSVSANPTSGFSVVRYTGNSASAQTVGHGLGVAPSMIIAKCTTQGVTNWVVYHSSIPSPLSNFLLLNASNTQTTVTNYWSSSAPTSTVFGVIGGGYDNNQNGQTQIAYCFAQVAGFSQFGIYTGNGSSDGPFIYTGFKPAFILYKAVTGSAYDWSVYDTSRQNYNVQGPLLAPNTTAAQATYSYIDLLSNGFKIRAVGNLNESGSTYVYAAFAENPFKYSNAG